MKSIKQRALALLKSDVTDVNEIARRSCLDSQQVKNALRNLQQQENIQTRRFTT
jgi:predicted ArsR family transcriptional regulator